jgi:hypothetical protein
LQKNAEGSPFRLGLMPRHRPLIADFRGAFNNQPFGATPYEIFRKNALRLVPRLIIFWGLSCLEVHTAAHRAFNNDREESPEYRESQQFHNKGQRHTGKMTIRQSRSQGRKTVNLGWGRCSVFPGDCVRRDARRLIIFPAAEIRVDGCA